MLRLRAVGRPSWERADPMSEKREGKRKRGPTVVRSVERATRIMEALLMAGPHGRRVSELSRELDLHKTTVVRLLHTLLTLGVVKRDTERNSYSWDTLSWLSLGSSMRDAMKGASVLHEALRDLAKRLEENVLLARPDSSERNMRVVAFAFPDSRLRVYEHSRDSAPIHAVAAGKAYLSGKSEAELDEWLPESLPKFTEHTITSPKKLREEILRCREVGYAVCRDEYVADASGLAVPVEDERGAVVAALDVGTTTKEMTAENTERWVLELQRAAKKFTLLLSSIATNVVSERSTPPSGRMVREVSDGINGPSGETELTDGSKVV
jgi:DNA-binding IclR family transcriptional regulator